MSEMFFDLQRFADVIVGKTTNDELSAVEDKTQVYGLTGNDTLQSVGKKKILLIGGSGNDVLQMTGGNGTLSGGKGSDTFKLFYSDKETISAVIEDIDPTNDKIVVTYDGNTAPQLISNVSGKDVIWTDKDGYFNLTLKGSNDASDYYEGTAHEYIWDILRITNQERENQGLSALTLSQGLTDGAMIRSQEIINKYEHVRPDGTSCFTAVKKNYWSMGENIYSSPTSPEAAMEGWMNSTGHRANILSVDFKKLGVGYTYDDSSQWKYHWVQMFGGDLSSPDTLSTDEILKTSITTKKGTLPTDDSSNVNTVIAEGNTNIKHGGTYTIAKDFTGAIRINTTEAVTIDGASAGSLTNVQILTYSDNATLTINNLSVTNSTGSVIAFGSGTGNKLTLAGKNVLKTTDTWAAVVNVGGGLTINGKGTLDVTAGSQGPGIGYNSYAESNANIIVNDCTITATTDMGAGIGSGSNGSIGNITINGGNITVKSDWGEEVGAGYGGSAGTVTKNEYFEEEPDEEESTTLTITNSTKSPVTVGAAVKTIDASKRTTAVKITGNSLDNTIKGGSKNDSLYGGDGNNYIYGNAGADKLFGQAGNDTLRGNAGNDTLTGGAGNDLFMCGAGKEVITDYATGDRISLASAITKTSVNGSDVVFTMGSNSLTVKNAKGQSLSMINSSGKSYSTVVSGSTSTTKTVTNSTKSPVTVGSAIKTINASKRTTAVKITGNSLANTIKGGSGKDSLYGGAGNDYIYGNAGADKLYGQAGNDTLRGNAGNDTLTGGAGNDLFMCGAGKEVITDYATGDRISLASAITKTSVSGSDVVFTMGSNSLTVKNAKGKSLSMINSSGKSYSTVISGSTIFTVTNSTKSPVTVGSAIKTIDASARTTAASIKGNALANSIVGGKGNDSLYGRAGNDTIKGGTGNDKLYGSNGNDKLYGQAGNDTLWGDAGNDSLWGGDGKDTFVYVSGDGKDIIYGFANNDILKITGEFTATVNDSAIYFDVDSTSNAITLKDYTATTLNINGDNYIITDS